MKSPTIGLFGTCGHSTWRDWFTFTYEKGGYTFYNPQVKSWTPEMAKAEAEHLASDEILLFAVTGETYGFGSLAEIGFAAITAIRDPDRYVIVCIDAVVDPTRTGELVLDPVAVKDSRNARALVMAHLSKLATRYPNIMIAQNMDELLSMSMDRSRALVLRA